MRRIKIPAELWFRNDAMTLDMPNTWKVDECGMAADRWAAISDKDIERALDRPVGSKRLEALAKGRKECVILFDDMSRPTRPHRVIPFILKRLRDAGIKKENIRFLISSGSHGTHSLSNFRKKLGKKVVENYAVYNHNCFENCAYAGKTKTGIPLYVNKEFLLCDLKIGIGAVLPHLYCGFSGGAKIVLPGISGIKTIQAFHSYGKRVRYGESAANTLLKAITEAEALTKFDFKIDFIFNTDGKEVACFAGKPSMEFRKAVVSAKKAYRTKHGKGYDVIIANAYAKSNEADIALHNTLRLLNPEKSIFVLVAQNPEGQMNHYLMRSYGKFIGGREYIVRTFLEPNVKYIILSSHKQLNAFDTFDKPEEIIWKKSWKEVRGIIEKEFKNPKVAVFRDATMQLLSERGR